MGINYCKHCGEERVGQGNFCANCGASFTKATSQNSFLSMFQNKNRNIIIILVLVIGAYIIFDFNKEDREAEALAVAQEFFESECMERDCEFDSFYDVEMKLKQKEDQELEQPGEYRISGGVVLNDPEGDMQEYYWFGMNVEFYEGEYARAGWPSMESDDYYDER